MKKDVLSKQEALTLSELTYRRVFESAKEGIILLNSETGIILDANKFLIDLLGFSKANFLGKHLWNIGILKDKKAFKANFAAIQKKKYIRFEDLQLLTKGGQEIQVEFIANSYKAGQIEIIQCDIIDITDRKKIELTAENLSNEYEEIVDTIADGLLVLDPDLRVVSANQTFYTLFKVNKKETVGQLVYNLGNKQWNIPELRKLLENILPKKGHVIDFLVKHNFESIGEKTMLVNARELLLETGQPKKIIIAIEDITRKVEESEYLLYASDIKYHKLFDLANEMIFMVDSKSGLIINANKALTKLLGYTKNDLVGKSVWETSIFKGIFSSKTDFMKLQKERSLKIDKLVLKTKSGDPIRTRFSSNTYRIDGGSLVQLSFENISELEQAKLDLKESHERLAALFDRAAEPTVISTITKDNKSSKFIEVNEAFCKFYGYTREEALNLSPCQIDSPENIRILPQIIQKLKKDKSAIFETINITKDGRRIPVEASVILFEINGTMLAVSSSRDITKRKSAETALAEKNALLEETELIGDLGSYLLDIKTGIWTSSLMMDKIFGIGKDFKRNVQMWTKLIYTEDREMMTGYFANNVLKKHEFFDKEYRVLRQNDKSVRWVHGRGKLEFDIKHNPIRMFGTIQDVTDKKKIADALEESYNQIDTMLNSITDGIMVMDRDWNFTYFNDNGKKMINMVDYDFIGKNNWKVFPPAKNSKFYQGFHEAVKTGKTVVFSEYYPAPIKKWLECFCYPSSDGLSVYFHDVTAKHELEENIKNSNINLEAQVAERTEELNKQKNFLDNILENIPNMIFVKEAKHLKFELFNKAGEKLLGQTSENLIGKSDRDFFPEAQASFFINKDRETLKNGLVLDIPQEPIQTPRGERLLHTKKIPILGKNGKPEYLLGISEDITEKKERLDLIARTKELAEITAKNAAILHSIGDAVFATDKEGVIVLFNKIAETTTGIESKNAIGQHYKKIFKFVKEVDGKETDDFIAAAITENVIKRMSNHVLLVRKDGDTMPITDSASPVIDHDGKTIGCVVVYSDATLERRIDKSKTEFVSLASHQLRTPLTSINWLSEMFLNGDLGDITQKQRENLQVISKSGDRMAKLVSSLLNVSKLELGVFAINPKMIDMLEIIDDVVTETSHEASRKKISIKIESDKKIPEISADPILLKILIQNLVVNAIHYSPSGTSINLELFTNKNNFVFICKDHGIGIPKEDHVKIFTKMFRAGNARAFRTDGNGLGLYITKLILDATGGKISFTSVVGKGSIFRFEIPLIGMTEKEGTKALEIV